MYLTIYQKTKKKKKKRKKKKDRVRLYWTGYQPMPIHGRDPTTARHGNFCLLCFHPGPVRPSLDNLDILGSPERPILMPSLVRTPDRHSTPESRTPALKPSSDPDLQVAGLQEHATTPSREILIKIMFINFSSHLQVCMLLF